MKVSRCQRFLSARMRKERSVCAVALKDIALPREAGLHLEEVLTVHATFGLITGCHATPCRLIRCNTLTSHSLE